MKTMFKKIGLAIASIALLATWFIAPSITGSGQNCDGNAVIYCGASSTSDLAAKIKNGTGQPNQSGTQLTALFAHYGIQSKDFGLLKEGRVTKANEVYVGTTRVARDVYSMGRHNIQPGSTPINGFGYPLYLRHPAVSFNSYSIPAWVMLNYDGTLRYAVIKTCGNIVPGVQKEQTFRAYALKWIDANGNARWDATENTRQQGITFTLTGNGVTQKAVTDSKGYAYFHYLKPGTYTITESVPAGYKSTTGITKTVKVDRDNVGATFGNQKIVVPPTFKAYALKWLDANENGKWDSNENTRQAGVSFTIKGNGITKTAKTDSKGYAYFYDLKAGDYSLTETVPAGFVNTTGKMKTIKVDRDNVGATFGNAPVKAGKVQIRIRKFEDKNADKVQNSGELGLGGWAFRVTGKNFENIFTTTDDGEVMIPNLAPGVYTVTEINQDGWTNTTGLTISKNVIIGNEASQTFIFGNKKNEGKIVPPGGGETVPSLPSSGPAGAVAATMSFTGGAFAWIKSKKNLLSALKK